MPEIILSKPERVFRSFFQHYDPVKYWKYRESVVACKGGRLHRLICILKLIYIKRCDAFNNASLGTHLGFGAAFRNIPHLPHGLYGIVVSHNASIGSNVTIFHQVTIGEGKDGAPIIGDNVYIGAGAKIIGRIQVGNNVKIGANCVVTESIPANATVIMSAPRIIIR